MTFGDISDVWQDQADASLENEIDCNEEGCISCDNFDCCYLRRCQTS